MACGPGSRAVSEERPEAEASAAAAGRSMPGGLDRIFRTALLIIPIGVIGNVGFSLLVTEREMLRSVTEYPRVYLLLALGLGVLPWFTGSLRLLVWTRFLGHRVRFKDTFEITLATMLGAAVSPTAIGGGLFKWGQLVQRGVSPGAAASLTLLEPFEDAVFFAIALPAAIVITASWQLPVFGAAAGEVSRNLPPVLIGTLAIALATWLVVRTILKGVFGRKTQRKGQRFLLRMRRRLTTAWVDARTVYQLIGKTGKARFAFTLTLTAIHWISRYSVISALVAFLGAPVQPVLFWLLQWIVFTLATVIPTPGAAGGAEAAFFVIYSPFLPSGIMGLATAGWRFFTFYLLLLLAAIVYILLGGARKRRPLMVVDQAVLSEVHNER